MNALLHYATCLGWTTGRAQDCTCLSVAAWRIRKDPEQKFPWRVWRHTGDDLYEPLMGCSSFEAARQLVLQFMWLRTNAIKRSSADV